MTTTFNPHASTHLGHIAYDGSETPFGVCAFGLTFEDANYDLADKSHTTWVRFQQAVISAMQAGQTSGIFKRRPWHFIPCGDSSIILLGFVDRDPVILREGVPGQCDHAGNLLSYRGQTVSVDNAHTLGQAVAELYESWFTVNRL